MSPGGTGTPLVCMRLPCTALTSWLIYPVTCLFVVCSSRLSDFFQRVQSSELRARLMGGSGPSRIDQGPSGWSRSMLLVQSSTLIQFLRAGRKNLMDPGVTGQIWLESMGP